MIAFPYNPPTVSKAEKGGTFELRYHVSARLFKSVRYGCLEPGTEERPSYPLAVRDQFTNEERTVKGSLRFNHHIGAVTSFCDNDNRAIVVN